MKSANGFYGALALLFEYPGPGYRENAGRCREAIAESAPRVSGLFDDFLRPLMETRGEELEELFTRTFDLNPSCALEVGWHLFGEDVRRGGFLVWMREKLREHGVGESGELPDHLMNALALMGRMDAGDAEEFAAACLVPALEKMIGGFGETENPYKSLIECVREVAAAPAPREEEPANA